MIILEDAAPLAEFCRDPKPHQTRIGKTRQPIILTTKGKAVLVIMSAKSFLKLKDEYELATLQNTIHELLLESFRSGKMTAEQLRSELRPNPRAMGIPAKEAFAKIRRRMKKHQRNKIA